MNPNQWLESITLEYGAEVADRCRAILKEADPKRQKVKSEVESSEEHRNRMYDEIVRLRTANSALRGVIDQLTSRENDEPHPSLESSPSPKDT